MFRYVFSDSFKGLSLASHYQPTTPSEQEEQGRRYWRTEAIQSLQSRDQVRVFCGTLE